MSKEPKPIEYSTKKHTHTWRHWCLYQEGKSHGPFGKCDNFQCIYCGVWIKETHKETEVRKMNNDVFRRVYRELSVEEKLTLDTIKNTAGTLMDEFEKAVPSEERSEKSRCVNIARTKLEEAIMWAVKGITY